MGETLFFLVLESSLDSSLLKIKTMRFIESYMYQDIYVHVLRFCMVLFRLFTLFLPLTKNYKIVPSHELQLTESA